MQNYLKIYNCIMEKAVYKNSLAWDKIKTEHPDVQVKSFPPEVLKALSNANDVILDEQASKDPVFKEILDSQRSFIKKARAWTKMGDYAYINNTDK